MQTSADARIYRETIQPFLRKYCVDCHGNADQNGHVNFEAIRDFSAAQAQRATWQRARRMLEQGAMPPADHDQHPTAPEVAAVVRWIDRGIFDVDCDKPHDPGHVTLRRLNRAEYNNTVHDLLGVTVRPADDFPSDDVGNGFDNMGEVLTISPLLMEKYLAAAESVTSAALFGVDLNHPPVHRFDSRKLTHTESAQLIRKPYTRDRYWVLTSSGSVSGEFDCPLAGDYVFRIAACARQSGDETARIDLQMDAKWNRQIDVTGDFQSGSYEVRLPLAKGPHRFVASFANPLAEPPAPSPPEKPLRQQRGVGGRNPFDLADTREMIFQRFELAGPFDINPNETALDDVATRRRILFCTPGPEGSISECATRILARFATRAFRRPLEPDEIKPFVELTRAAAVKEPFDRAVQIGLSAILVSPHFLFRVEKKGDASEGADPVPIGPFELASRLSYFLWSSMPDDELFRLAADGSLPRPEVLESQVQRMLHFWKSRALVSNFAVQWLNLAQLDAVRPNVNRFKTFDRALRADMRRETELFCASVIQQDRSIFDLLNGNYTFINERLAKHYGIGGVTGDDFRLVSLETYPRRGVLTQASILTLTSQPTRTSPVKRGKWILETILGNPPPPPPPSVPDLRVTQKANPDASLREQLAIHRKSAQCSVCHKVMDPLGLGLENFDGIGRWREKERGRPVDASGTLPGGESFRGPLQLIGVLTQREGVFRRHLARTLLTYALGRGLEYHDACAVDRIVSGTQRRGDRFSDVVTEIVLSEPFLKRRGGGYKNE